MTIAEFALAREVARLLEEAERRILTKGETRFLVMMEPYMDRFELREMHRDPLSNPRLRERAAAV